MAEASLRSAGQVSFPRGFVTPKVGPHQTYGFAPGKIFGAPASLLNTSSFIRIESPQVEYITAISTDKKRVYLVLMNDVNEEISTAVNLETSGFSSSINPVIKNITELTGSKTSAPASGQFTISLPGYGLRVFAIDFK
jgi:hypothetical protein